MELFGDTQSPQPRVEPEVPSVPLKGWNYWPPGGSSNWATGKNGCPRVEQMPRFYFFDCGVILGEQMAEVRAGTRRYGALFENFVVTEFFRQRSYLKTQRAFYSWRTVNGAEVDLVIDQGLHEPPIAVEIKSKEIIEERDIEELQIFARENEHAKLFCISRTVRPMRLGDVQILPWQTGITGISTLAAMVDD
jgi:predicted AAA+ superfamily ATPase